MNSLSLIAKVFSFVSNITRIFSVSELDLLSCSTQHGKPAPGQLEQNFVVLKESDSEAAQTNFNKARMQRGRGRGGRGADRGRERGAGHGRGGGGDANTEVNGGRGKKRPNEENLETSSAKK